MTLDEMVHKAVLLDDYAKKLAAVPLDDDPLSGVVSVEDVGDADAELKILEDLTDLPVDLPADSRLPWGSAIGLNPAQRIAARKRIVRAAWLGYQHRGAIHYTQRARRWAISTGRRSKRGQYPNYADCSAYATYLLWDATHDHHTRDFVNGAWWRAGFTGTMVRHGVRISRPALVGDCIFYGGSYWVPHHVAVYIGNGRVFSHGSESGPYILRWNYRHVTQIRRYLR